MYVLVKVIRWVCPACSKVHETQVMNERAYCVHVCHVEWENGEPVVIVDEGYHMLVGSVRWV